MAIIPRNELEPLLNLRLPRNPDGTLTTGGEGLLKKMGVLQERYDRNLVIGGLHRVSYREFLHDEEPLTLIIDVIPSLGAVLGFNFHYLVKTEAVAAMKFLMRANSTRVAGGKAPLIPIQLIEKMPLDFMPYRLYKIESISPKEYIPFGQWEGIMRVEISKWQGFRDFGDVRLKRPRSKNKQNKENKATRNLNERPRKNKANLGTFRR